MTWSPTARPSTPGYSRSGLTCQAGLLEKAGLVTRAPSPDDGRGVPVSITEAGRALIAQVLPGHEEVSAGSSSSRSRVTTPGSSPACWSRCVTACARHLHDQLGPDAATTPGHPVDETGRVGAVGQRAGRVEVVRQLAFARPLCPDNLWGHLVATAVPGVEEWREGAYRRTLRLPGGPAVVALPPPTEGADHVVATLWLTDPADADRAEALCRRILDLDADPVAVDAVLRADPVLAPLVDAAPGRRVPGCPDPAEFAVRAVLGQQVSTAAARTHAARLVRAHGDPVPDAGGTLTHLFPDPPALGAIDPDELGMPRARRRTLIGLVTALATGDVELGTGDLAADRAGLATLPGIGPWTVESVAMRALGDPDAFLPTDLGVRAAAERLGLPRRDRDLVARAQAWRPYRAHATQYLWAVLDHAVNILPG